MNIRLPIQVNIRLLILALLLFPVSHVHAYETLTNAIEADYNGACHVLVWGSETVDSGGSYGLYLDTTNIDAGSGSVFIKADYSSASRVNLGMQMYFYNGSGWSLRGSSIAAYYTESIVNAMISQIHPGEVITTPFDGRDLANCAPIATCEDENALLEIECGGSDQVATEHDNETCDNGTCECAAEAAADSSKSTYADCSAFCGSPGQTNFLQQDCSCACLDCSQEYATLEANCLSTYGTLVDNSTWDPETCTGDCKPDCGAAWADLQTECGLPGINLASWSDTTCEGLCNEDCSMQLQALETKCGIAGVAPGFDNTSCEGDCRDCDYLNDTCATSCGGNPDWIKDYSCNDAKTADGAIIGITDTQCICKTSDEKLGLPPGSLGTMPPVPTDLTPNFGGIVTQNPDGSYTETTADGTTFTYKDGEIWMKDPEGNEVVRQQNPDGSITTTTKSATGQYTQTNTSPNNGGSFADGTTTTTDSGTTDPGTPMDVLVGGTSDTVTNTSTETTTTTGTATTSEDPATNDTQYTASNTLTNEYTSEYDTDEGIIANLDWTAWDTAKGEMGETSIGQLSTILSDITDIMTEAAATPSFSVDLFGNWAEPVTFDLTAFQPILTIIRFFMSILILVTTFHAIKRIFAPGT